MGQGELQGRRLNRDMGAGLSGKREPIGQGRGTLVGFALFRDPDQDAADVLEHGFLPLSVSFGYGMR